MDAAVCCQVCASRLLLFVDKLFVVIFKLNGWVVIEREPTAVMVVAGGQRKEVVERERERRRGGRGVEELTWPTVTGTFCEVNVVAVATVPTMVEAVPGTEQMRAQSANRAVNRLTRFEIEQALAAQNESGMRHFALT